MTLCKKHYSSLQRKIWKHDSIMKANILINAKHYTYIWKSKNKKLSFNILEYMDETERITPKSEKCAVCFC